MAQGATVGRSPECHPSGMRAVVVSDAEIVYNSKLCIVNSAGFDGPAQWRVAMPIYAYRCDACGFEQDVLQKLSDAPLKECPSCHAQALHKMVTAAGFQLKGSGWYATDFRNNKPAPAPADGAGKGNEAGAAESKSGDAAPAAAADGAAKSDGGSEGGEKKPATSSGSGAGGAGSTGAASDKSGAASDKSAKSGATAARGGAPGTPDASR